MTAKKEPQAKGRQAASRRPRAHLKDLHPQDQQPDAASAVKGGKMTIKIPPEPTRYIK